MDLFTTLKNRSESLALRSRLQSKRETHKTRMSELVHQRVKKKYAALHNVKRRAVLRLQRVFLRKKWLSIQFFSLASLVNLYLAVLDAQNEQIRQKRLLKFTTNGSTILKRYKKSAYKRYRKALGKKRRKEPSLSSIENAIGVVYSELKIVKDLYQRRLEWKRITDSARSLIRGDVHN